MDTEYPLGMAVSFADASATVTQDSADPEDATVVIVTGTINGAPLRDENGEITHVPVWAERDNGREATTIIVAVANLMGGLA